jgi:hypothetical protein
MLEVVQMSGGRSPDRLPAEFWSHLVVWPRTRLGEWAEWAVGLSAASVVLLLGWSLVGRLGGVAALAMGLTGGVAALVAILRRGERALAVFAALLPCLSVVAFLVAELVGGH